MKRSIGLLLLQPADGGRNLRFGEPSSGVRLEERLQPDEPVGQHKKRREKVFSPMLEREVGVAA